MLKVRTYQVIIHIAGWLLFMGFPLLFINGGQSDSDFRTLLVPYYWLFCFTYIFLFYFNAYLLIPGLFLKRKYILYGSIVMLLFAGVYFLQPYDRLLKSTEKNMGFQHGPPARPMRDKLLGQDRPSLPRGDRPMPLRDNHDPHGPFAPGEHPPGDKPPRFGPGPNHSPMPFVDSISLFIFLMIVAISTAIKIIQQWQLTEQRAIQAEADKASAELSFLKAQINPHFLFNTLNNIYTLAVIKDDNAPDSIMKLSNIMRYVTDDATEDFVPLQNEIDCIHDYIELQRLRLGEKTQIDIDISGNIEHKKIAPLILMTFIENVFKYGISKHTRSVISIKIWGNEKGISFFCQNHIFPDKNEKKRTGIGLKNTRQRLEHLYPGKHELTIDTENKLYTVKLVLQINDEA
ncbi:MAG TPA: sensor histidine kinase [Mucilaginibacter sp.]|nr:sensor histidine kinase [Mucilaginibacter sp.]